MVCYHPITAYQLHQSKPNGKKAIVFGVPDSRYSYDVINLPCGQCIGCRLERSRQWATRCVHEASLHAQNCFLTLTYDDEHIRWSSVTGEQTLYKRDLQLFMKRLRKYIEPIKVRFFACGEYGDSSNRPHYHVILFGYDFPDKRLYKLGNNGYPYYISDILNKLWTHGYCMVAAVSFDSCAYVARYITKKLNGEAGKLKYEGIQPEFINMSRRPGIGAGWFEKYSSDVYPYDRVIIVDDDKTRKLRPPRYYDKLYDEMNHEEMELIKLKRVAQAKLHEQEIYTPGRLEAKEKFKLAQIKSLERGKTDEII